MFFKNKLTRNSIFTSIALVFFLVNCIYATWQENSANEFEYIFDGKTLNGWEGDPVYWRVENGNLIGEVTPETVLKNNTFLIWKEKTPKNFELKLEYRISETGNSGINYRSIKVKDLEYALKGYQLDIDGRNRYTGQNYEERARTTLAYPGEKVELRTLPDSISYKPLQNFIIRNAWSPRVILDTLGVIEEMKAKIRKDDWNECHLVINDNRLLHYINGMLMSDVTDNDLTNRKMEGYIGIQVHVGPPMKVEFRSIRIKYLD